MGSEQTKCRKMPNEIDEQKGGTCYAHASYLVFIETLKRKKIPHPNPKELLQYIISKFGKDGAHTKTVLEYLVKQYKLNLKVSQTKLQQAASIVSQDRPLALSFRLQDSQMEFFSTYFNKYPQNILKYDEIPQSFREKWTQQQQEQIEAYIQNPFGFPDDYQPGLFTGLIKTIGSWFQSYSGHAVVIESFDKQSNSFLCRNSWGPQWGDKGKFRIHIDTFKNMKLLDLN